MKTGKMPLRTYNEIYREQDQLYRTAARIMGLSEGAFWLLYTLREAGRPLTQSHICAAGCLPKQTVHSALQKQAGAPVAGRRGAGCENSGSGAGGGGRRPGRHGRRGTGAVSGAAAPVHGAAGTVYARHGRGDKGEFS